MNHTAISGRHGAVFRDRYWERSQPGVNLPGPVALDLEFPVELQVDHIRVFQRTAGE